MSFILCNAALTFQWFMDSIRQELDFCYGYIDDLLIASTTPEEHLQQLRLVLERLNEYGLSNVSKNTFGFLELIFGGSLGIASTL